MSAANINRLVFRHGLFGSILVCGILASGFSGVAAQRTEVSAPSPVTAIKTPFLSHRVVYSMTLGRSEPGSGMQAATGQMFYRFQEGCADWEVETRVFLHLLHGMNGSTEESDTTWSYESQEDFRGDRFTFNVEHKHNGGVIEALAGNAWRTVRGVTATYDTDHDDIHMPKAALFPTAHLLSVFERARAGETRLSDIVFDGASQQNPYRVNVFIVGRVIAEEDKVASNMMAGTREVPVIFETPAMSKSDIFAVLPESPVWRVRLAYFPTQDAGELPEFEIEVDFREDGVAQRIIQDFGDFQLNLSPVQFEALSPKRC